MTLYNCPTCGIALATLSAYCPGCRTRLAESVAGGAFHSALITLEPQTSPTEPPPLPQIEAHPMAPFPMPEPAPISAFAGARRTLSLLIVVLCVVTFLAIGLLDAVGTIPRVQILLRFGLSYQGVLIQGRLYQFLTAPFIHANVFALVFNMLALITLGPAVERTLGAMRYLQVSVVSYVGSIALFLLLTREANDVAWGYAPILFGIFVVQAVYFPEERVMVYGLFPLKMKYTVILMGAIALYSSAQAQRRSASGLASFGGAAAVWLYLKRLR
jgi:membrane associated rhomboid family serine protease